MVGPIDAIAAFHNAFRRDMTTIDAAALALARGDAGQESNFRRFQFFNEMLVWHAHGEEAGIFPELERVAPLVAEAYVVDHRGLDKAFDALSAAVSAGDRLAAARAAAAFKFHLDIHLDKEDVHLYRLVRERVPAPDQARAVGIMAGSIPADRFADVIAWLYPLLGIQDRENTTRIWQMLMPAPVFAGAVQLVRKTLGDDWPELARRIPELA
jgi:hypothetical protein